MKEFIGYAFGVVSFCWLVTTVVEHWTEFATAAFVTISWFAFVGLLTAGNK